MPSFNGKSNTTLGSFSELICCLNLIGLLGATTWITTGLFSIPLATFFFWPKYKTKKIIAISTFIATLSIVGQSLAPTYEILFLFRVLYSFFAVLPLAFWVAIRIGWFSKKEYGTVGSISMAFSNLGQFFALGLIPYLLGLQVAGEESC